jgi:PIN domain nuclease of toxin-antitoxin system
LRLLLDTCTFLWVIEGGHRLSASATVALTASDNEIFLSAVSAWEIAQKHASGKLPLPDAVDRFVTGYRAAHGILALPLDEDSTLHLARLPALHKDPFDRMLVCQAIAHGLAIVTPDPQISQYPVRVLW